MHLPSLLVLQPCPYPGLLQGHTLADTLEENLYGGRCETTGNVMIFVVRRGTSTNQWKKCLWEESWSMPQTVESNHPITDTITFLCKGTTVQVVWHCPKSMNSRFAWEEERSCSAFTRNCPLLTHSSRYSSCHTVLNDAYLLGKWDWDRLELAGGWFLADRSIVEHATCRF